MTIDRVFWSVCIPCGAIATALGFWIFARMERIGFERKLLSFKSDVSLYRLYWQKAPGNGWSRAPLIAMGVLFGITVIALLLASLFLGNR
jgi:hypothetical protein